HRMHQQIWKDEEVLRVGQTFWRFLREWHSLSRESFPVFGRQVEDLLAEETLTKDQPGIVGLACFRWLRSLRSREPQQFLAREMLPIEMLLRSMRTALNNGAEELEAKLSMLTMSESDNLVLKHRLEEAQKYLDELHNSASWRVTKPLREIKRIFCRFG